jgi:hypothetical protein
VCVCVRVAVCVCVCVRVWLCMCVHPRLCVLLIYICMYAISTHVSVYASVRTRALHTREQIYLHTLPTNPSAHIRLKLWTGGDWNEQSGKMGQHDCFCAAPRYEDSTEVSCPNNLYMVLTALYCTALYHTAQNGGKTSAWASATALTRNRCRCAPKSYNYAYLRLVAVWGTAHACGV